MAELAELKRELYRHHAPVFHRPKAGIRAAHEGFLGSLVADAAKITLVHEADDGHVEGFIAAALVPAPPVYDPGRLTCSIDDFMVERPGLWPSSGRALLEATIARSKTRGAVQTVVVCGPHDEAKRSMLLDARHVVASEWFTRPFLSS